MTYSSSYTQDLSSTSNTLEVEVVTDAPTLCRLLWRQEKLWVVPPSARNRHIALPALAQPQWFQACLENSKAKAVVVDPHLGAEVVSFWMLACAEANKPLYLRLPAMGTLPEKQKAMAWRVKCAVERILGLGLLLVLSPLMLIFAMLLNVQDGGPALTYHWCVGQRGKLFAMAQFRRTSVASGLVTRAGKLLEISRLDRLPRLLNVARGEMALVGTKPWIIEDAVKIPEEYQPSLKALPGVIGRRPLGLNLPLLDVTPVIRADMAYLKNWSLLSDSKAVLWAMKNGFTELIIK